MSLGKNIDHERKCVETFGVECLPKVPHYLNSLRNTVGMALIAVSGLTACNNYATRVDDPYRWRGEVMRASLNSYSSGNILSNAVYESAFDEKSVNAITASSDAFTRLGEEFVATEAGQNLLRKRELNVLVPAAGILLSPLDMVFVMLDRPNNIQKVNITMTEISSKAYESIDTHVKALIDAWNKVDGMNVTENVIASNNENDDDQPKVKTMQFTYTNGLGEKKEIVINYEYKMSGERYYRKEAAVDSDIIILHDIGDTVDEAYDRHIDIAEFSPSEHGVYEMIRSYDPDWKNKPHYVVSDFGSRGYGRKVLRVLPIVYGCGENHWDVNPHHPVDYANFVEVTQVASHLLDDIYAHGGQEALDAYALLVVGKIRVDETGSKKMLFDHRWSSAIETVYGIYQSLPDGSYSKSVLETTVSYFTNRNSEVNDLAGPKIQEILGKMGIRADREHI